MSVRVLPHEELRAIVPAHDAVLWEFWRRGSETVQQATPILAWCVHWEFAKLIRKQPHTVGPAERLWGPYIHANPVTTRTWLFDVTCIEQRIRDARIWSFPNGSYGSWADVLAEANMLLDHNELERTANKGTTKRGAKVRSGNRAKIESQTKSDGMSDGTVNGK